MHVLAVPQPFAHLVVRGIKRIEVRTWEPPFKLPARVAIHASVRAPIREDCEDWFEEREPALAFAEQGWLDRGDLVALPRGAIVGSAILIAVHIGDDVHSGKADIFAWNHETERMEVGERNPETGALKSPHARTPLSVIVPRDQYAWVFADPVEFEPITGVKGNLRTWKVDGELADLIAERERCARKKLWRPAPVDPARRDEALDAYNERWNEILDYTLGRVESDVRAARELKSLALRGKAEARARAKFEEYFARHPHPRRADWVMVEPEFRPLFGGVEVMTRSFFELTIRRKLKEDADALAAAERHAARRAVLTKIVEEAGPDALLGPPTREPLLAKIAKTIDKMLEEEEEDLEFAKREANPRFERRMERAKLRKMTRRPTDPEFDYDFWKPLIEKLLASGLTEDEVAVAMAWEQLKTELLLDGEA